MTRKPDEWMPLHIGAYHADTTHLTRDQHGAYLLLLMAYWRRGEALPATDGRLAAIVKATAAEWRKLKPIMAEFFEERDGGWHQKRADEELTKAKRLTEAKAEAGRKGAASKWQGHDKGDGKQMAEPSNSHRQTDAPLPSPSPVQKKETEQDTSLRSVVAAKPKVEIPEWIPRPQWDAFIEMRGKTKAKPTEHGILLLIAKLRKMRATEDIGAVLDQSTMHNWKGVFPVKHDTATNGNGGKKSSGQLTFIKAGATILDELFPDGGSPEGGDDYPLALEAGRTLLPG